MYQTHHISHSFCFHLNTTSKFVATRKMKLLIQFMVVSSMINNFVTHRFGYSPAEQKLWRRKHLVRDIISLGMFQLNFGLLTYCSTVLALTNLQFPSTQYVRSHSIFPQLSLSTITIFYQHRWKYTTMVTQFHLSFQKFITSQKCHIFLVASWDRNLFFMDCISIGGIGIIEER